MKNIRNNWITKKTQEIAFSVDGVRKVAKWDDIRNLYRMESKQVVKIGQNVKTHGDCRGSKTNWKTEIF